MGYSPYGCKEPSMTEGLTLGFPDGTSGKEPAGQAGDTRDLDSIPGLRRCVSWKYVEPKNYNKLLNKTKEQTHRYREETSGYQWEEGKGEEQYMGERYKL